MKQSSPSHCCCSKAVLSRLEFLLIALYFLPELVSFLLAGNTYLPIWSLVLITFLNFRLQVGRQKETTGR